MKDLSPHNPLPSSRAACLVVLGLATLPLVAGERYEQWQAGRPYTLAGYGTHDYGGGGALDREYFLGSGLNTAHDTRCGYNSSRAMVEVGDLPLVYMVYGDRLPDLEGFIADFERARKFYRNIIALQLGDEVRSSLGDDGLKHMRRIRDWVVSHPDPAVRNLLLITCTPAGGRMAAQAAIRDYMNDTVERMRPDAVLAQMYGPGRPDYYASLQWFFDWCRRRGVSMWVVGKTWSSSKQNLPTESEMRLQKFVNLAYGVRGMFDFLWGCGAIPSVRDGGYWNVDARDNPTPLYRQVAPVNREVAHLARCVVRLHPVRAYHMDSADDARPGSTPVHHWSDSDADLPAWQRRGHLLANVTGAANRNHLLVALYRDDAGETYFMVVNKDFGAGTGADLTTRVALSFHPSVRSIRRLRRDSGAVETIDVDEHFGFDLPGGTGALFRFAGDVAASDAFAGVEPLTRPRLVTSDPADGSTAGRLSGNALRFTFDRDARNVHARIRRLEGDDGPVAEDTADGLERTVIQDGRTLVYRDRKGILVSGAAYRVDLHWADAAPLRFTVVRGDVDGDGTLAEADAAAVADALGAAGPFLRADLDDDGQVTDQDVRLARRSVAPLVFDWSEDFEAYDDGALAGQGPWLTAETLPGSVLSRSWISQDAMVGTAMSHVIAGSRSASSTHPGLFIGNEARFLRDVGAGGVGRLIIDVSGRVNTASFHNHGFHIWNSQDVDGARGGFTCEIVGGSVSVRGNRGLVLGDGTTDATLESVRGVGDVAVHAEIDFSAGAVTWSCRDIRNDASQGPFVVPFSGGADGLDAISIMLRGEQGALDDIRIQGR